MRTFARVAHACYISLSFFPQGQDRAHGDCAGTSRQTETRSVDLDGSPADCKLASRLRCRRDLRGGISTACCDPGGHVSMHHRQPVTALRAVCIRPGSDTGHRHRGCFPRGRAASCNVEIPASAAVGVDGTIPRGVVLRLLRQFRVAFDGDEPSAACGRKAHRSRPRAQIGIPHGACRHDGIDREAVGSSGVGGS